MEIAIQKLAVISFFVIGLSHLVQPRVWAQFFMYLRDKGKVGSFINAFVHFPLGALIIAFHNVWDGIPIVLTLIGYGWALKSLLYFVFPSIGVRALSRVSVEKSKQFIVAGVVMLAIGSLLGFSLIKEM